MKLKIEKIKPLDIREMEDGEISDRKEKALNAFIEFWEQHGPILLTQSHFKIMNDIYNIAHEQLEWLERINA
jgi:hypothetical protein